MNISNSSIVTEESLPIALTLYLMRTDIEKHSWDEYGTWRFINGTDKRYSQCTATCSFIDAVAAFLMREIGDYYGDWISETLEQVSDYNNGKIIKVCDINVKHRSLTAISQEELDILIVQGFQPINTRLTKNSSPPK